MNNDGFMWLISTNSYPKNKRKAHRLGGKGPKTAACGYVFQPVSNRPMREGDPICAECGSADEKK